MPRITSPFRKHSGSWIVNTIIGLSDNNSSNQQLPSAQNHCQFRSNVIGAATIPGSNQSSIIESVPAASQLPYSNHSNETVSNDKHSDKVETFTPSFWGNLRLLLWKNHKLLIRNKLSTTAELFLPLLFTILLVTIRLFGAKTETLTKSTRFERFRPTLIPATIKSCCNQIYYTPDVPIIQKLMKTVGKDHFNQNGVNYSFIGFKTEEELLRAYANSSNGMYSEIEDGILSSTVLAGIVFTSEMKQNGTEFPLDIEYSLRFPATLRSQSGLLGERFNFGMKQGWFTEILYPIIQTFGPRAKDQPTGGEPGYWSEGFLYLQQAVETELINSLKGENITFPHINKLPYSVFLQRFPYPPYTSDDFLVVLQPFLPLVLILSFIFTVTTICKTLVTEKERRIHESMKIMGLTNSLHWTGWFITFLVTYSLSILMITFLLKIHLPKRDNPISFGSIAVLPNSDPTLIFFCLLVHGFQLISFCFFISSLFKTANGAAITSSVFWFMLFLPFPFLQPRYSILSSKVKTVWSLLTNMGICFCCQLFCMFEGSGEGAQWSSFFKGVTPDDTFCIGNCVVVMLVNGLVYFIAACYINSVWPGEYGVGRKWNFFLSKRFWFKSSSSYEIERFSGGSPSGLQNCLEENLSNFYERPPKSLQPGIEIRAVEKSFGDVKAIENMNLTMYKNESFCLLGKNGAGKSTLVSILTGVYPYTRGRGKITINGKDIGSDLPEIRKSLGVCPQHNILFDELTVEEHLIFFASLKGMKGQALKKEVNRMINAVGLAFKRKAEVRTLSGGMKRRLCVGIAFCGDSRVVILDEPSAGLDVEARKGIWDLIEMEKGGRTVLLTTHFMEEAELLADRIAVIVNGKVRCCGSPLFLNKKYNGGYNLTIVLEDDVLISSSRITEFISTYLPEAELIRSAGKEITYTLPESKANEFHVLFDAIERKQKELGIETFGAKLTSMEDIFIRVNNAASSPSSSETIPETTKNNMLAAPIDSEDKEKRADRLGALTEAIIIPQQIKNKSSKLLAQQFYAMSVKKLTYVWRRRGLLIGQTLIPMAYLSVVLIVLQTIPGIFDPPPHRFELDHYELFGTTVTLIQPISPSDLSFQKYFEKIHKLKEIFDVNQNRTFSEKILEKEVDNIPTFNAKYFVGFEEKVEIISKDQNSTISLTAFFNNQPLHTPPLALNMLTNMILLKERSNHTVHLTNHPFPYTNLDTQDTGTYWTVGFHVGYNTAFALTFVVAVFATFLVKENISGAFFLQRASGLNPAIYWISNFIVDYITYLVPCVGLLITFALFSSSTEFFDWNLQGYLFLLFLAFGWAFIPLVYVLSQCFQVPAVGFAGCGVASAFSGFITILTITVLELPQINQGGLALTLHRVFLIFPTYALGRGITQISINKKLLEKCAGFNLEFLCDAAPDSYCCVKLQMNYMDWDEVGIGKNLTYMIAVGLLFMLIIILMESSIFSFVGIFLSKLRNVFVKSTRANMDKSNNFDKDVEEVYEMDEDVKQEQERVGKQSSFNSDALFIKCLSKNYGSVKAVESLSFGVEPGKCFGLLGTNGAGKTSTFKMLVGEIRPDSGDAFISSHSIVKERKKTHKIIGYCPQFDAILGEFTGRETLIMFGRLRGVKENEIKRMIDDLAAELGFQHYLDKLVNTYSGGNKRKLSTAVALIGMPKVVFLDEPTASMDPLARRQVWAAIHTRVKEHKTCVLLTSHSLEECEILCTRIAIMKNGHIQCLGSPQQLKNKYGNGFSIVIQIKGRQYNSVTYKKEQLQRRLSTLSEISTASSVDTNYSMQIIDNFLRSHFPPNCQCVLTSSHANYLHYHIKPLPANEGLMEADDGSERNVGWSTVFETMESLKEQVGISAYSISQISLEQVFLSV